MENRESESELNECKKKLNKAHQTIEELKIKMTQDKKNYKWEIRELNKEKDALKAHNTDLFNRESNALIRADDLEKENITLEEFLINKKYVVIQDGDERCEFTKIKKTGLINFDAIDHEYPNRE